MSTVNYQIELENLYSQYNTPKYMRICLEPFENTIKESVTELELKLNLLEPEDYEYTTTGGEVRVREDLIEVHQTLLEMDIEELFYAIYAVVIPNVRVTLQQAVGAVIGRFSSIHLVSRRLKAVEILLEAIPLLEVEITKGAEYAYVSSMVELDESEIAIVTRQNKALPSVIPMMKVKSNSSIGYRTFTKSIIMGGKHHSKEVVLEHINRCNNVAFALEPRMFKLFTPAFDPTPKVTKRGTIETKLEVEQRKLAWDLLYQSMPSKLTKLINTPFYFAHRYDCRGRTYVEGYELNYQGDSFQKAIIELHKKELITPEW